MSGFNDRTPKSVVSEMIEGSDEGKQTKKKTNKKVTDTYKLRQQSYYLDEDLIQAIEMRLFANKMTKKTDETDKSALVRAALSKYLKAELQQIKEKQ